MAFINEVLRSVRALPGVESAAAGDSLPFQGGSNLPFAIEGQPRPPLSQQPIVPTRIMTPGFVQAIRMRLIAGRDFTEVDRVDRELTVIISQAMARSSGRTRINRATNFLRAHLEHAANHRGHRQRCEAARVERQRARCRGVNAAPAGGGRRPVPVHGARGRIPTPAETLAPTVVKAIHGLNADLPVRDLQTMDSLVDESIGQQRFAMTLISTFAGLAVLLAAIGIYSVLSYSVGQRVSEIGIRRALGAPAATLIRTVVSDGMKPALVGIVIGLAAAAALGRVMTTLLFGVGPHDAVTLAGVSIAVVLIALLAAVVPAYRATRINPLQALRTE